MVIRTSFSFREEEKRLFTNLDVSDFTKSDIIEKLETVYFLVMNNGNTLILKQRERLSYYSWDKSAEQIARLYENYLQL